jgi:hypothetical protein
MDHKSLVFKELRVETSLSPELRKIRVDGIVSQLGKQYAITTDDETRYTLSAIMPWESVSPDYGTEVFAFHIGKKSESNWND